MSGTSEIEWTDATWNPVRGCVKVSPGCKHCYAETFAERFRGVKGHAYKQGFDPRLVPDALDWPLHRRKPLRIFVNSMSDLFGDFVSDEYIAAVFGVMSAARRHTFQVLTKRAERLPRWFEWAENDADGAGVMAWLAAQNRLGLVGMIGADHLTAEQESQWPLPNVWLGVSVEDRRYGLPRIDYLRKVPAAVRFVSFEPLLEHLGLIDLSGIQWVIIGAESGPGRREMREEWVRSIVVQAKEQGCKVFFKQAFERGKKVSLPTLDGRQWAEFPEAKQ